MDPTSLERDHVVLTQLLQEHRTVSVETAPIGVRMLWNVYLVILEDALTTLNSLINFLPGKS